MVTTRRLDLRLSLTLAPHPSLITYYEKHHCMSPVVHIGDKAEEEPTQEGDGLLYLGGDNPNAGLEAIPDSLPNPPSS
jgi:hypothetical protein